MVHLMLGMFYHSEKGIALSDELEFRRLLGAWLAPSPGPDPDTALRSQEARREDDNYL